MTLLIYYTLLYQFGFGWGWYVLGMLVWWAHLFAHSHPE